MPSTAITESDTFTATLLKPTAGELASAPGIASEFLQGAANRMRWLYNRLVGSTATSNITDVIQWVANLRIPSTAELAAPNAFSRLAQDVGDRTAYLKQQVEALSVARVQLTGTGVAAGAKLTLSNLSQNHAGAGAFAIGSNHLTVPSVGTYLVHTSFMANTGTPNKIGVDLNLNGGALVRYAQDFNVSGVGIISFTHLFQVINAAHPIDLTCTDSNITVNGTGSHLSILRLKLAGLV